MQKPLTDCFSKFDALSSKAKYCQSSGFPSLHPNRGFLGLVFVSEQLFGTK
jgi:hypothetical protein